MEVRDVFCEEVIGASCEEVRGVESASCEGVSQMVMRLRVNISFFSSYVFFWCVLFSLPQPSTL